MPVKTKLSNSGAAAIGAIIKRGIERTAIIQAIANIDPFDAESVTALKERAQAQIQNEG